MDVDCPSTRVASFLPTQYLGYFSLTSILYVTLEWFLEGHESITQIPRSITTSSLPRSPTSNKQHPSSHDTPSAVLFRTDCFHDRPFMLPTRALRLCHGSNEGRWIFLQIVLVP